MEEQIKDYIELTDEEAREFLNKYDKEELEYLDFVFYFAMSHDLTNVRKIADEVYKEKDYEYDKKDEEVDITKKNGLLNYKELNFLYNLTSDGALCTSSTPTIDYSLERKELTRVSDSLYEEMQKRVDSNKKPLKLNIKIKKNIGE